MSDYLHVAMVTLISLILFLWMGIRVGSARQRHAVTAPATTGHPEFERHFRVQANTLEGLVMFLPSLWLFAIYVNEPIAAGLGLVWVIGRIMYMMSYVKEPTTRGAGFGIQAVATMVLMVGGLGWVAWRMVAAFL